RDGASSCYDRYRRGNGKFFFSSRRRHTRWPRDWSSDVCSSDLLRRNGAFAELDESHALVAVASNDFHRLGVSIDATTQDRRGQRSEERRVGKESRTRWWRT